MFFIVIVIVSKIKLKKKHLLGKLLTITGANYLESLPFVKILMRKSDYCQFFLFILKKSVSNIYIKYISNLKIKNENILLTL